LSTLGTFIGGGELERLIALRGWPTDADETHEGAHSYFDQFSIDQCFSFAVPLSATYRLHVSPECVNVQLGGCIYGE
jgi:hypothetical protein